MVLKRDDIIWCQLHNWYPIFKRNCLLTEFLKLDQFLDCELLEVYTPEMRCTTATG